MSTPATLAAERVQVHTSTFYVTLGFVAPGQMESAIVVSIPIPVAKELSLILRKHMTEYEQKAGKPIELPPESYKMLGISPEDWPRLPGALS